MLKIIRWLTGLFIFSTPIAVTHANSNDAEIIEECQRITQYANQGAKFYQQKNYLQALKMFKQQAARTDFCSYHEDITKKSISLDQIATAYNNVGLSYTKLGQPRWARAWFEILPEAKKSQHNLSKLPAIQPNKDKTGLYVRYSGQAEWNTLEITDNKDHYNIQFYGVRMGIMALLYGPNMGEFQTTMPKNASTATYQYEDCVIKLNFLTPDAKGNRIQVTQNQNESGCGFGFGVYADGNYDKVENIK